MCEVTRHPLVSPETDLSTGVGTAPTYTSFTTARGKRGAEDFQVHHHFTSIAAPRRLAILFLLLSAVPAAGAVDDAVGSADKENVETIVVTAYRTPVRLEEVASAVSVVSETDITRRQQSFAADLLRDLPGVSLGRTSTNGSLTQVRVRGSESNHLLVVIDGVKVNDPAAGDEFNFGSLTSFDIESIELVRGPQSALWGSDAMAGVLQIRTRRGQGPLAASAFFQEGSFGTVSAGARASAATGRGEVSLNASRYETDGVSAAVSGSEKDGYANTTLGLNGRYDFTESFYLGFSGRYTDDSVQFDGTDLDGVAVDTDDETDKELFQAALKGGLTLLDGRWDSLLRLTYLDTDNRTTGNFPSTYAAQKKGVYYQSTFNLGPDQTLDSRRLILAVDYEEEDYRQRTAFADQDQTLDNLGIVLEYLAVPIEQLIVSASIRHDDNSEFKDVTTWRITGSYLISEWGTRIKATAGTGQKRPGFTERFGFSPDFFVGNPDLAPEQNQGFDLGVEQRLPGTRVHLGATYFDERLTDEIALTGFPSTPINLAGESRRRGVELTFAGTLSADLSLTANYTYTDSQQPKPAGAGGDEREIRRPRHQAAMNLNQAFSAGRGNLNLNLSYTGSQTDLVFSFPARMVTLDAYTLVNLSAEYALTSWLTLFGRAENLFDERQQDVAGFQNPGRGFYAGLRVGARR